MLLNMRTLKRECAQNLVGHVGKGTVSFLILHLQHFTPITMIYRPHEIWSLKNKNIYVGVMAVLLHQAVYCGFQNQKVTQKIECF